MKIQLANGKGIVTVDKRDAHLSRYNWHLARGRYAARWVGGRKNRNLIYMHREICGLASGDKRTVDHKNRNPLDNRRSNLRVVTQAENCQNQGPRLASKSGVRGVYFDRSRQKWVARVMVQYKTRFFGRFETLAEAETAVVAARKELMIYA